MKQTPLYDEHVRLGGRIIDFGGWALPVPARGASPGALATWGW